MKISKFFIFLKEIWLATQLLGLGNFYFHCFPMVFWYLIKIWKVLTTDHKFQESIWLTFMKTCLPNLITKILWKGLILQDWIKKTYIELSLSDQKFWNSLKVDIIKCRFGIIDCTAMMKTVKTMYGYCKEGQPSRFVGIGDSPKWQRNDVLKGTWFQWVF